MKKLITTLVLANGLLFSTSSLNAAPSQGYSATQQLGTCLVDSLNGKERKDLAKWIFFAMSAHPEIQPFAKVTNKDLDGTNRFVGGLITRLLTSDCPSQAKAALQESGSLAIQNAFRLVGEVAMQELMTNQQVTATIGAFEKYVDQAKMAELSQ
ncbi:hypothetical protein DS2_07988 [Catenovulum agarivorans DS-2]|uniref:Uncharacterized protein n=1 Tax=Catenovulum agarivorans DS-2 TaxID=1328313 RepID=W7QN71_9ALTE|nr:hypothetical protein [Catenovulum agarivorans]EWH10397.1 hypothetical protein DS2_07988 [Catenovulum agarivorans DS-2]